MKQLHMITFILLVVGGLNWLASSWLGFELGRDLLGGADGALAKIVYLLVGLSAIYELATHKNTCKDCAAGKK